MLSSVLKIEVSSIVSINIMRTFVKLRKYISSDLLIINNMLIRYDNDIEKYNKQYSNLVIKYDNTFHDRYFILDNKIVYHLGPSINHAESKIFFINLLEDNIVAIIPFK